MALLTGSEEKLEVSSSEEDTPKLTSIVVNTDSHINPATDIDVNTSPLCILNMEKPNEVAITTHNAPTEMKCFLKIAPKPTTQVGCIPLISMRNIDAQTDSPTSACFECRNEEHLILQRQAYIKMDAVKQLCGKYEQPITSTEDRQRMNFPNRTSYLKWVDKFQQETKPKNPVEFQKAKQPVRFNSPEITITSKEVTPINPKLRKP